MNSEKEKLLNLLNEGKISEEDFKELNKALDKKGSSLLGFLINPFHRIAGSTALILGIIILFIMSGIGSLANCDYAGILDLHLSRRHSFSTLLFQNAVSWIVLSSLFFLVAYLNKQKGLRIIDFLGTTAFSRFPYLVFTIFMWILVTYDPSITEFRPGQPIPTGIFVMAIPALFAVVWQITTYLFALKESSGLTGKKLRISFILAIVIGEAISVPLTRIFY